MSSKTEFVSCLTDSKDTLHSTDHPNSQQHTSRSKTNVLKWLLIVVSLLFSMFLFALDNAIVANIQPYIIRDLGEVQKLPWISIGYAMGATSVNLSVAKLFTSFDNKVIFIFGVVMFEVGSAICGAAPNMNALICGRVISGVACTAIYIGCMNLLSVITTKAQRPFYLSLAGLTWGLGTVLGPVIGGAFADGPATWRWCFYINLCVGALVAPVYIFLLPSHNPDIETSLRERISRIDWLGSILFAGATVSLIMGISFGGSVYSWSSPQTIVLFTAAGILWITFALQQYLTVLTDRQNCITPMNALKDWEMSILFIQISAAMAIMYIPMFFIPLYFQFVRNETALHTAVYLLPFIITKTIATVFNGATMTKFGYYMPWYFIGGVLSTIGGSLLYATVTVDVSKAFILGASVLCGLGSGLFAQSSYPVAQGKIRGPGGIQSAVAFIGCGQIIGITLSLAISNTVFLNKATQRIQAILPDVPLVMVQNAISGVDSLFLTTTLDQDLKSRVLGAIVRSISDVYALVIAAGSVVVVLSVFMRREKIFAPVREPAKLENVETMHQTAWQKEAAVSDVAEAA